MNRIEFWRTFWSNAAFAPRTTLWFMRLDYLLGELFVVPFTQIAFFAFIASLAGNPATPVAFVVVGNAIATVTFSSVFSVCQTTDREKNQGTMEHLLVSPSNRTALYLGRGAVPILISMGTVAMGLVYATTVYGVSIPVGALAEIAVSVTLTAIAMVGFGLLLGGVALFLRTSIILGNIFLFAGLLLSGANFPLSYLPAPLQWAGDLLPLTWGISAIRAAVAAESLSHIGVLWGAVGLSAAASYGLAVGLWKVFERRALRTGSIVRF